MAQSVKMVLCRVSLDCVLDLPESSRKKDLLMAMSGHILQSGEVFRAAFPWLAIGLLLAIYFGVRARKKNDDKNSENYGVIGMCMGMCIGISLQGIIGSVGTGITLGMLAGLVIGSLIEKKWPIIIILLAMMAGLCGAICFSYFNKGFTGERIKNSDSYVLEIEKMNGEDEHALELTEGDVLVVHSSVDKGSVNLEITGPDGQVLYVGNEKSNVDEFNVNIHESGKYTINVDAHHAKGRISVILE